MHSAQAFDVLPRVPHRGHFTKRLRTATTSHWLIRQFVETCAIERATREFVAPRAGYHWRDLMRWEAGETVPPVASIEACFNVLGRVLVIMDGRGRRVEIPSGVGHWSRRVLPQVRRSAEFTQTELAQRIGRCKATMQNWESGRTTTPLDGFCDALTECRHRLGVRMAEADHEGVCRG